MSKIGVQWSTLCYLDAKDVKRDIVEVDNCNYILTTISSRQVHLLEHDS